MLRSIFAKEVRDRRRTVLWWAIGSAAIVAWVSFVYPILRDSKEMKGFIDDLPSGMLAVFGIDPATYLTGAGFLQAQFFSLFGPLMIIGLTVSLAVRATAREERDGTMDMLLSVPVSRLTLIAQKTAAIAVLAATVTSVVVATMLAMNGALGMGLRTHGILSANLSLLLLGLVFGALTLAVGAYSGEPSSAIGVGVVGAAVAWFVNAFANLFDWLELPAKLSPFTWYHDGSPLIDGWATGQVWLSLATVALAGLAFWMFHRRNISIDRSLIEPISPRSQGPISQDPRAVGLLRGVLGKVIWDKRHSLWGWAGGLLALLLLTFAAWPAFSKDATAISGMVNAMPKELFAMFGMTNPDSLATAAGFISSRTYQSVGPIVMTIFAVGSVAGLIAREESTGTLDMTLSNPVSRRAVLLAKAGGITLLTACISLVLTVVGIAGNAIWGTHIDLINIVAANTGLGLLALCFGGIAIAVWSCFGSAPAIGASAAIGAAAWFLNGLGAIVDVLAPLRSLSPFYWYLGDTAPLARGFAPQYLLLLVVAIAGTAIGVMRFGSRDLAV